MPIARTQRLAYTASIIGAQRGSAPKPSSRARPVATFTLTPPPRSEQALDRPNIPARPPQPNQRLTVYSTKIEYSAIGTRTPLTAPKTMIV